jgi:hypothetical protein
MEKRFTRNKPMKNTSKFESGFPTKFWSALGLVGISLAAALGANPTAATSQQPSLTILPETGSSFLASQEIEISIESSDRFGVTNIQLYRDNVKVAEGKESPMRYTVTNAAAGNYVFLATATFKSGLASTSSPVSLIFTASGPEVSLAPGPTEFISETHVKSSPATLLASVVGINPNALTKLTLNGVPQPLRTGNFKLNPPLTEGENVFVLTATDNRGRTNTATTTVFLNTKPPTVLITDPANNAPLGVVCVDVHGTFTAKNLKRITVNQMPATIRGNTFEALNVMFMEPGTNRITVVAEDMAGNTGTNTISVLGPTDFNAGVPTLPVQVQVAPPGGIAPLPVTFKVRAKVPGKIQKVFYDFDGDHVPDLTNTDLQPVAHTYNAAGQYFFTVTVQTDVGRFSNPAGMLAMLAPELGGDSVAWYVNVQTPPVLLSTIKVTDPVDVKWTAESNLYVLSGSTSTIIEFNANGKPIRSKTSLGLNPSGLAVDGSGNVYVAVTGSNQVWKFKPTTNSFEADTSFGNGGFIGNKDGSAGSGSNQLNAPFDVVLSGNGQTITVSDSGNQRLQQFARNGTPAVSSSVYGGLMGQLKRPTGLANCDHDIYLLIIDSGNNRIVLSNDSMPMGTSGTNGAGWGQFNGSMHLDADERALYVADTGNNRVQVFDPVESGEGRSATPFNPRLTLSGELGLNHPKAVAAVNDLLEEKLYIADTGNNRVILVKLPQDNPEAAWNDMVAHLKAGDVEGAVANFSFMSKDKYREAYSALSKDDLQAMVKDLSNIQPVYVKSQQAQYYFETVVQGQKLMFPIEFIKELGHWKIVEF